MLSSHEHSEPTLLADAAAWPEFPSLVDVTPEALQRIGQARGIDFATAVLYDRLRRSERHAAAIQGFTAIDAERPLPAHGKPALLAIVPGAFYRESPRTGADGRLVREEAARLGIASSLVPVKSFGAIDDNARIVRDWLRDCRTDNIVLLSLSKGGAEVKRALALDDAARLVSPVRAWVNLSGVTEYSPLADWLLKKKLRSRLVRLWFWWRGYDFDVVHELARRPSIDWRLPPTLRAIHVVGFPLQRHLSTPLARRGHRRMAYLGPNDGGGNALAEVVRWPGEILPVWGADHYLRPPHQQPGQLIRRVLHYLCETPAVHAPAPTLAGVTP